MQADCLIVVERAGFEAALSQPDIAAPFVLRDPYWCRLLPTSDGLQIETPWLSATLAGGGQWSRVVGVPVTALLPLTGKLGVAPSVRLLYAADRLLIDNLSIEARDFGRATAFKSQPAMRRQSNNLFPDLPMVSTGKRSQRAHVPAEMLPLFKQNS